MQINTFGQNLDILAALLWTQWVALGLYAFVALMWLVPDRRIERALSRG